MSAAASRINSAAASRVNSRPSSQMSLMVDKKLRQAGQQPGEREVQCKICLYDCPVSQMVKLDDCGCTFCKDVRFLTFPAQFAIIIDHFSV